MAGSTPNPAEKPALPTTAASAAAFLAAIGSEVRRNRAKRGMTRRQLAQASQTSERYLAQIESGVGNPSVSVLRAIAQALDLPCSALLPEAGARTAALGAILDLLAQVPEGELPALAKDIETRLARPGSADRARRIALVGLRGAGKSTLGRMLAQHLGWPFIELDRLVEEDYGASIPDLIEMAGTATFRRHERSALDRIITAHEAAIITTAGGIVAEPGNLCAVASPHPHDLDQGAAGRSHEPRHGPGRFPPHGAKPRRHGRPRRHPRGAPHRLFPRRGRDRHLGRGDRAKFRQAFADRDGLAGRQNRDASPTKAFSTSIRCGSNTA